MSTVRKIPMRKCVGCNERKTKKELVRVVKSPDGTILLDATGKQNGRGAYLCRNAACLQKAQKNRSLARSLDIPIPDEIYAELEKEMRQIEAE